MMKLVPNLQSQCALCGFSSILVFFMVLKFALFKPLHHNQLLGNSSTQPNPLRHTYNTRYSLLLVQSMQ
ncbi:hypothetical protein RIF29_38954 [Crotalaria pallida]|uniref:Uncharacterized protein n=1 Tax=Crotalaria pallida TaxID=3830 RepID=A0AAN9E233_CROPI